MNDDENARAWVEALTEAFWREDELAAHLLVQWHSLYPESEAPLRATLSPTKVEDPANE